MKRTRVAFVKAPEQGELEDPQIEKEEFFSDLKEVLDEIDNKGYRRANTEADEYILLESNMACVDCFADIDKILKTRGEWGNYGLTNRFTYAYPEYYEREELIGITACQSCGTGHFMIEE